MSGDPLIHDEKEELLDGMTELVGTQVPNARYVLKILTHPDLIEQTLHYFRSVNEAGRCQKYQAPWSCAKEAEAYYQNIKYGWLGAANGVGYHEGWCPPCTKRVMED